MQESCEKTVLLLNGLGFIYSKVHLKSMNISEILTAIFTGVFAFIALCGTVYRIITRPRLKFGKFIEKRDMKTGTPWYYLIVKKNKRGKTAKNCRGRLRLGKDYNADSRWGSSRLKECDIHNAEYLRLFAIEPSPPGPFSKIKPKSVKLLHFLEGVSEGEPVATKTRGENIFPVIDERHFPLSEYENEILTISLTSENAKTPNPLEKKISEIISKAELTS